LLSYAWPGNARQLRNVIERAAVVCASGDIQLDDLPDSLFDKTELTPPLPSGLRSRAEEPRGVADHLHEPVKPGLPKTLPERLRDYEERILRETLASTHGNQSEAARLLGLPRRTLAHKVHGYGLARS
jgi:DNA-binding NtrC family response regulator